MKNLLLMALMSVLVLAGCISDEVGSNGAQAQQSLSLNLGGTVAGLASGQQVTLVNNEDTSYSITISSNGQFVFPKKIAPNSTYNVTVLAQPTNQTCTISNYNGVNVTTNVSNINVVCSSDTYTLSGVVSGLVNGQQFTMINNGNPNDSITADANTSFTFLQPVAFNGSYNITISAQPANEVCTVNNYKGNHVNANITNIHVVCSTSHYTIGGTLSGLATGQEVTLINNDDPANVITLNTNGSFVFPHSIAFGGNYFVSVAKKPNNQYCTITNELGLVSANVTNVQVVCAKGFSTLYAFQNSSDGSNPSGALIEANSAGLFYGVTSTGGAYNRGGIFKITADGTATNVYSFGTQPEDGKNPVTGLTVGNFGGLYGVTLHGGYSDYGTVFKLESNGFISTLKKFLGGDGAYPSGRLLLAPDGNLYGMTSMGGQYGKGSIYKIDNNDYWAPFYSFGSRPNDGAYPYGSLVLGKDGNLYGTTTDGGAFQQGTVFKISTAGVESVVYSFSGSDGSAPFSGLVLNPEDNNFYGVTLRGGSFDHGVVFKITAAGAETVLHSFADGADGAEPEGTLLFNPMDQSLYGMTLHGGTRGDGTLFKITSSGVETVLHSFQCMGDGCNVSVFYYIGGELILGSNGNIYGIAGYGFNVNNGVVFVYYP